MSTTVAKELERHRVLKRARALGLSTADRPKKRKKKTPKKKASTKKRHGKKRGKR